MGRLGRRGSHGVTDAFSWHLVRWRDGVDEDATTAGLTREYEVNAARSRADSTKSPRCAGCWRGPGPARRPRYRSGARDRHAPPQARLRRTPDRRRCRPPGVGDGGVAGEHAGGRRARARGSARLVASRWTWAVIAEGRCRHRPGGAHCGPVDAAPVTLVIANAVAVVPVGSPPHTPFRRAESRVIGGGRRPVCQVLMTR
jgi:hypothetical protein